MERIVPLPAFAAVVIVAEDPLEAFDVRLAYASLESQLIFLSVHMELIRIVAELIAFFSQLYLVLVFRN